MWHQEYIIEVRLVVYSYLFDIAYNSLFIDHRIGQKDITKALAQLDISKLQCYICGPPPMTEDMLRILLTECHVDSHLIHYEKWW